MSASELKAPVFAGLKRLLAPLGYRKGGALFSLERGDVLHLVEVQSSDRSTATQVVLTVNLGVFVPALIDADVRGQTKPTIAQAHWRERLGAAMPGKQDKWWTIGSAAEGGAVAAEIVSCVADFGLKAIAQIPDVGALRRMWQSGASPGLTEVQRRRYLARLAE